MSLSCSKSLTARTMRCCHADVLVISVAEYERVAIGAVCGATVLWVDTVALTHILSHKSHRPGTSVELALGFLSARRSNQQSGDGSLPVRPAGAQWTPLTARRDGQQMVCVKQAGDRLRTDLTLCSGLLHHTRGTR